MKINFPLCTWRSERVWSKKMQGAKKDPRKAKKSETKTKVNKFNFLHTAGNSSDRRIYLTTDNYLNIFYFPEIKTFLINLSSQEPVCS